MTSDIQEDLPPRDVLQGDESQAADLAYDPGATPEFDDSPEALQELIAAEEKAERAGTVEARPIPQVRWAADREQPDYAHTLAADQHGLALRETFDFNADVFNLLVKANHFKPKGKNDLIIFGLRGGRLNGADKQIGVDAVKITDVRPDHASFQCTLGLMNLRTGKLSAFAGSTVPNRQWMRNYYKIKHNIYPHKDTRCNILPSGCYIYRVAPHGGGRIYPAMRLTNPDQLTEDGPCTVLRTYEDLTYSHDDLWDKTTPYDNIHCAYYNDRFSSAGCQTIKGEDEQGPWGEFQEIIGSQGRGARLDYVLLTGREAAIAVAIIAAGRAEDPNLVRECLERLRVGSEGDLVTSLQKKLGFNGTGYFGPATKKRLTRSEESMGVPSDGVYSPADDTKSGWRIFPGVDQTQPDPDPANTITLHLRDASGAAINLEESPLTVSAGTWHLAEGGGLRFVPKKGLPAASVVAECMLGKHEEAPNINVGLSLAATHGAPGGLGIVVELKPATASGASTPNPPPPAREAIEITAAQFEQFAPNALAKYHDIVVGEGNAILSDYGINASARRLTQFLAQVGHESGGFRIERESLYYTSARRLMQVWPSRFPTEASARPYTRNERKLAEKVYGGRLGNNSIGDGYKYRGRGLVQLTGKGAYEEFGERLGIDLVGDPDLAVEPRTAFRIACEYWASRKLPGERGMSMLADDDKLLAITYRVNGGYTNLDDREFYLNKAREVWPDDGPATPPVQYIDRGDWNDEVRVLQRLLVQRGYLTGRADGKFGYSTYKALRNFKRSANLDGVGYADPATLQALRGSAIAAVEGSVPSLDDEIEPIREGISLGENEVVLDPTPMM